MRHIILLLTVIFFAVSVFAQPKLTPHSIKLKSGKTVSLNLPADYEIIPAVGRVKARAFFRQIARRADFCDRYV